ncbi:flagellar assembly protein FliW [Paenibacillus endoradicis]|uniref:flagellar assembly protein FliW n=1 Tax=Paenibacillus endoradicis TaxID=2972487 RepID=UPI00215975B7|nr:flagellar assembly protein FliW [Paenibacillus endoradicis]MCR8660504.1 flagellar assembly protein FliW [Paenibacillus endoradicis]
MGENTISNQVIKSDLYGEIIVEDHQIFHFAQGIVGFSHLKQFALLPYEDTELFILQSFSEDISLLLFPAVYSGNNISFRIDEATVDQLGVKGEAELAIFYVLRFIDNSPFINLRAPILIVSNTQKGCQYVVPDESLSIRAPLELKGDDVC